MRRPDLTTQHYGGKMDWDTGLITPVSYQGCLAVVIALPKQLSLKPSNQTIENSKLTLDPSTKFLFTQLFGELTSPLAVFFSASPSPLLSVSLAVNTAAKQKRSKRSNLQRNVF